MFGVVAGNTFIVTFIVFIAAKKYSAFIASDTLIKQIPKILGPGLNRAGKFPTPMSHSDSMNNKVEETRATIKFQLKKVCFEKKYLI